jgi:hypothetical protein
MKKHILTAAALALAASLATSAEARVSTDDGAPRYQGSVTRSHASKTASARRHGAASTGRKSRNASGGRSGGGSARGCLTSEARALLGRIESRFGPVSIVSTCRPGAVIATTGKPSKHRHGQAIDFDAGSRKGEIVRWLVANHHAGGTMTYRDMGHIHVDVGYHFVKLNARSGHG